MVANAANPGRQPTSAQSRVSVLCMICFNVPDIQHVCPGELIDGARIPASPQLEGWVKWNI